jgi:hypothetical protein
MHRDIKRSLVFWPAAASAAITAASWMMQAGIDWKDPIHRYSPYLPRIALTHLTNQGGIDDAVPMSARTLTDREPTQTLIADVQARVEHGSRAMQLPHRVAEAYGVRIPAPTVDQQREMAGWVESIEIESREPDQLATIEATDAPARTSTAATVKPPAARPTRTSAIELVLESAANSPEVAAAESWTDPSFAHHRIGTRRSAPSFPSSLEVQGLALTLPSTLSPSVLPPSALAPSVLAPSVLPRSTRVLAKPAERQHDDEESAPTIALPSTAVAVNRSGLDREPEPDQTTFLPAMSEIEFFAPSESDSQADSAIPLRIHETPYDETTNENEYDEAVEKPEIHDEPKAPLVMSPRRESILAGWPSTTALDLQLQALTTDTSSDAAVWAANVVQHLTRLQSLPRIADPSAGDIIQVLKELAQSGLQQAEQIEDRQQQIQWLLSSHALARRVAIWEPIWKLGQPRWMVTDESLESTLPTHGSDAITLIAALTKVRTDIERTGDQQAWKEFLLLDEIETAAKDANSRDRTILAQRLLSRLQWHGLDEEQQRWLQRDSIEELAFVLRPWARGAIDYANLLRQLERQEADAIDLAAIDIANSVQSLRFADTPPVENIGNVINTYYRNANVRLALSQSMLQRMLPNIEPQQVPVRTTILGSRVRGTSRVESDLRIQLLPSADRWHMELLTLGNVQSQTTGFNSGVAVRTSGTSRFTASTPIEINADGIDLSRPQVAVRGSSQLRGIRSDYDGWPLVGSLARNIAKTRFESIQSRSNHVANQRIGEQVGQELERRLNDQVDQATAQLSNLVLGPLGSLQLDPKVMDLQTTDTRLVARYRLAGDWQLAAFTPRPRAPQSSLMSLQIHQSALNNTLEQLIPRDRPLSIAEIVNQTAETFGQPELDLPDDMPQDVTVQFAKTRPITFEIEDGRLWITMRVLQLRHADRPGLTRFIVRACYLPEVDGMEARLVRDGHLRISGPGMSARERLPIRAIFNKVLSPNRPLPLTLPQIVSHPAVEGLVVSQLELRDGWVAMAISEADAPRLAIRMQETDDNR